MIRKNKDKKEYFRFEAIHVIIRSIGRWIMTKKAVVLSGGGARGAYQVGVWKALRKLHYHYKIVTGTSVGALNGALMVQRDYDKCLKLWENINFDQLFIDHFPTKIDGIFGKTKVYQKYASNFIKNGGMDTSRFEKLVYRLYNPFRFFHSSINFGMITYNRTTHRGVEITKKEMTEENVPSYIIASASCYPAFPMKKINGEDYIDGGYSDNLPINLAIDLGATEIVAVDLNAVGRKRKIKNKNIKITMIEPKNHIVSFLVFQESLSKQAISYGYNDTMKAFGKFEGNFFTFYKKQLKRKYQKNGEKLKQLIEVYLKENNSHFISEHLLRVSLFHRLSEDKTGKRREAFFYELIEMIGKILKMNDTKVYKMKDFSKESLIALSKIDSIDLKKIEEKIKNKATRSLFGTSTILRYLYNYLAKDTKNKQKKEYRRYALLFPKEFIAASYLIILNKQYSIIS